MIRKAQYRCPCCGGALPQQLGIDPKTVHLGANQQALFNFIKKFPNGVSCETIRERVFGSKRNGDSYAKADSIVAVVACHTNKKIKAWGLRIQATGGPGSMYRLVRL